MSAEGDSSFWTWLVGLVSSTLVGLAAGTWAASRKVTLFEATQAQHATDITALKLAAEGHSAFCARQKQDLLDAIRKEICNIVKLAIKDMTIEHHSSIASLDKNVALIAQSNEQMEAHIAEIFNRLNRRDTDHSPGIDRRGQ